MFDFVKWLWMSFPLIKEALFTKQAVRVVSSSGYRNMKREQLIQNIAAGFVVALIFSCAALGYVSWSQYNTIKERDLKIQSLELKLKALDVKWDPPLPQKEWDPVKPTGEKEVTVRATPLPPKKPSQPTVTRKPPITRREDYAPKQEEDSVIDVLRRMEEIEK